MRKRKEKRWMIMGAGCLIAFAIWTGLIQMIDVQTAPQNGADVGFATFNY